MANAITDKLALMTREWDKINRRMNNTKKIINKELIYKKQHNNNKNSCLDKKIIKQIKIINILKIYLT